MIIKKFRKTKNYDEWNTSVGHHSVLKYVCEKWSQNFFHNKMYAVNHKENYNLSYVIKSNIKSSWQTAQFTVVGIFSIW